MEKEVEKVQLQEPELLMPSGTSVMGFHYLGNWEVSFVGRNRRVKQTLPDFYTVGQQTVSYSLTVLQAKTGIIGAALKPTALWHWLKTPLDILVNNPIESSLLFGAAIKDLTATFKQLPTHEERIDMLMYFFQRLVAKSDYKPGLVETALEEIFNKKGCVSTKQLLSKTGFKERSLQQNFKKQVGISPMQYARIIRFNNLFVEIAKNREDQDLSFLSLFYNYYDASHLNKDFKRFCGEAPSTFYIDKFKLLQELIEDTPYLTQVQH